MNEVTRKTVLRLALLAALLAAYPATIIVLRAIDPLSTDEELGDLQAHISVEAGAPPCSVEVSLGLVHPAEASFEVASVGLSVLEGDDEQLTRLETGASLEARIDRHTPGSTRIGPFCIDLPPSDSERMLLVTTRVSEPDSGRTRSLMKEALLRDAGAEVIDPEGVQRPDFLRNPQPPESAP